MKNTDLINDYLDGQMFSKQQESFLKSVESDPDLRQELNFQQQIIEGIKSVRKAELKARLDQVTIGTPSPLNLFASYKTLIIGGIAAVSAMVYYTASSDNGQTIDILPKEYTENIESLIADDENSHPVEDNAEDIAIDEKVEANEEIAQKREITQSQKSAKSTTPSINKPTAIEPFDIASSSESMETPDNGLVDEEVAFAKSLEVKIEQDKRKYDFHYQFTTEGLTLYGDFNNNLYEIIEVNPTSDKLLYLYYNSFYYSLDRGAKDITELTKVNNSALIENLNNIRKNY